MQIFVVTVAIIALYGKASCVDEAWVSFVKLSEQDVVLWTTIIAALLYIGQAKDDLCLFEEM